MVTMKRFKQRVSIADPSRRTWLIGSTAVGLGLITIASLAAIVVYTIYKGTNYGQRAVEIQKQLEAEFVALVPMPGASQVRYTSMNKARQGEVGADYKTSKSYTDIRTYYDSQLKHNGWSFIKEKPVKVWGRDYGGKQAFYCKANYTATLQFAGSQENEFGWTYSFGLSWGLFDECGSSTVSRRADSAKLKLRENAGMRKLCASIERYYHSAE
jgi:hypothetical protein